MKRSGLLFFIIGFIIQGFLIRCAANEGNTITVSDSLRQKAIQVIRLNLKNQSKWEKVHAAEYLLWLGYPQEVKETFLKEEHEYGTESPYKIGIWRVLAQADTAPEKKKIWVDKILNAYQDPNGTDRVHAAETLAKLHISLLKESPEITRKILADENSPLSVYTLWGASISTTDSIKSNRSIFLDLLTHDQEDTQLRGIAAYALRHLGGLNVKEWFILAKTALSEPDPSEARVYLLSAAFVTTPDDSVQSKTYFSIKGNLLKDESSLSEADRMEMAAALAEKGNSEDLPILISLMNNGGKESSRGTKIINDLNSPDLRAVAAYAILRIDRRLKHDLTSGGLGVIDAYLLGMFGTGFYYYRKNKNGKDFFLGSEKMNPVAVGLSLFATFTSAITYLAAPGEMIKHGPVFFIVELLY